MQLDIMRDDKLVNCAELEHELIQTKELLEQAGHIANVGAWSLNLADSKVRWSAVTRKIHETSEDFQPVLATGISFYKEGWSRQRITELVSRAITLGEPFDEELQIVTARGKERWVRAQGKAEFQDGRCVQLYGAFQDIHEQKLAEDARRRSEESFRLIAENVGEVFWLRSAENDRMLYVNPAYERVWGRTCQSLYANPQSFMDTIYDADKPAVFAAFAEYSRTGFFDLEYRIVRPDGEIRWLHAKSSPIKDLNGAWRCVSQSSSSNRAICEPVFSRCSRSSPLR